MNYLGVQTTSFKDQNTEVRQQAIRASTISGCLHETVWSNRHLRNETKVRIYNSVIGPILTYAAERRTDTAKTAQILEVRGMQTVRRIINKTRTDKMRNEGIREICGIQTITSCVRRIRTEWSVHIARMVEDRLVTQLLSGGETEVGQ